MTFYKRHLPHWQPVGAEFFITFRLAGSLPEEAVGRLKSLREPTAKGEAIDIDKKIQRKIFEKYEDLLHDAASGPTWLENNRVADVVKEALHFYDGKKYDLYAYTLMPNHVHLVFKHLSGNEEGKTDIDYPITKILQSIKSYTASKCNKILNRTGKFWQSESYDRVVRDQEELENTIRYVLNNPVKGGLVKEWEEWKHSYCKPEFIDAFKTK